jgi:hypothetical protein
MAYSEAQVRANNKWISNNKEKWNELCKTNYKTYYDKNAERVRQKKLEHYYAIRELEIFRKILL